MGATILFPNRAAEKDVIARVRDEIIPLANQVRRERRTLRETWLRYYRIWSTTDDQNAYRGRQQTYIGILRKIANNWVRRLRRDLFPNDQWFQTSSERRRYESRVGAVQSTLEYQFREHVRLRRMAGPFLRQLVTLGTSPVKCVWRQDEDMVPVLRDLLDPDGNATGEFEMVEERVLDYFGTTFRPVDLFAWYIHPVTCMDVRDAVMTFEDLLIPPARLESLAEKPIAPDAKDPEEYGTLYDQKAVDRYLEERPQGGSNDTREKWDAEARRLQDKGFTYPLDYRLPNKRRPADVTEMLWKGQLADDERPYLYLVTYGGDDADYLFRVQRRVRNHYLVGKFDEVENEFYGRGVFEGNDRLQYLINDLANQTADSLTYAVNPITVVDMYRVQDPTSLRYRPGAKWLAEVNSVKAFEIDAAPAVVGLNAVQQLSGTVRELSDITPLGGSGKQKGRGTQSSQGMQLAISEAQVEVTDIGQGIEEMVLEPYCDLSLWNLQHHLEKPLILRIEGRKGGPLLEQKIDVADLIGEFRFRWLGSTNVMNQQVRAAQMANGLQIFSRIPPEVFQAQGKKMNLAWVCEQLWSVGWGLPNGDRLFEDTNPDGGTDPTMENDLMRLGRWEEVAVSESDNDDVHMQKHQAVLGILPPHLIPRMESHIRQHQAGKMAKEIMKVQQQASMQGLQNAAKPGKNGQQPAHNPGRPMNTESLADVMKSTPRGSA